jgi:hypothetical protein
MTYSDTIKTLSEDPEQLERLYHEAAEAGQTSAFRQAIDEHYATAPDNLLLAGWHYRLRYAADQVKRFIVEWRWALPLAFLNGFLFWWLTDEKRFMIQIGGGPSRPQEFLPVLFIWGAPLAALFILIYFTLASKKRWQLTAAIAAIPLLAAAYVSVIFPQAGIRPFQEQYLNLTLIHLPLLAWALVGGFFLIRHGDTGSRLRFLVKSVEVILVGGVFAGVLFAFAGITIALFDALNVAFSTVLLRLIFGGGLGVIIVLTPTIIYDPSLPPAEQTLSPGLARLVSAVMQVLLPVTVLVLTIYIAFIPANFRAPFDDRNVLITYNVMLFAVVGLLAGTTALRPNDIAPGRDRWLRRLLIAVAVLTLLVSLYALSAILFRTANDGLTPNRLAFVGWNVINVGLLALILLQQWRARADRWLAGMYRAFRVGTTAYAAWTVVVILAIPWIFGVNQGDMAALPASIQNVVFEEPRPVLLKCYASPHIYLLDRGEKRWIEDIATFNARGYVWGDVSIVPCPDLRRVPDGTPIPADAGPPPQP